MWKPAYYSRLGWNAYNKGAFTTDGRPTKALDAFGGKTVPDVQYPASLGIYKTDYSTLLATMQPAGGMAGIYSARLNAAEPWMNFVVYDAENGVWYGTDPSDKTIVSTADDKWNFWIDSDRTGCYDVTVDLTTMRWTHTYNASVETVVTQADEPVELYDILGRVVTSPQRGNIYVVRQGATATLCRY